MGNRRQKARALEAMHPAWRELCRGRKVPMRVHPSTVPGFVRATGCEPHGQVEDWVRSMPDGSRLHAHVFPDGRVSVHRDRFDPNRGTLHRVAHVALETRGGQIAVAMGALRLLGWLS